MSDHYVFYAMPPELANREEALRAEAMHILSRRPLLPTQPPADKMPWWLWSAGGFIVGILVGASI